MDRRVKRKVKSKRQKAKLRKSLRDVFLNRSLDYGSASVDTTADKRDDNVAVPLLRP